MQPRGALAKEGVALRMDPGMEGGWRPCALCPLQDAVHNSVAPASPAPFDLGLFRKFAETRHLA